ncbi:hypothetical protein COV19_01035 [Candidatus Woesearchaeota archaeon CG10_big_fil_rev_8_21_14_0_10_44_13]|nr:MAG: hypothetical protein COV19_01035 [Candidatus Woesearchaeota archaeon CG10_big_fil_rev_8_21_14_0_10_44_13]
MKIQTIFTALLLFCLLLIPVSAQDANTLTSEDGIAGVEVRYGEDTGAGLSAGTATFSAVSFEVEGSSVLLNGMNIAEKSKGQSYVSSNLMVTYSMGAGKVASTAGVPSKYSSTGALMQSDMGNGTKWYYLKEVDKNGENVFEGKEKVTVSWEYPLLENQDWKPAAFKDNLMEIPEGENAHFITNGNLVLPGQFIIYSVDDDDEAAKISITDPAKDCSTPNKRCSATLKTSELNEGYYYIVYIWQSGGKTYISNSLGVKIGDPGDNSKAAVVLNDAQTGEEKKLFWTPKYAQYYGTWGNVNKKDISVYQWSDDPSGISIGSSTSEVKYDLSTLGLSGLTFTVKTDWKTYTTLVFSNNKKVDITYDGGKILLKPSAAGDWGNGIILTNDSNQHLTITRGNITKKQNASTAAVPPEPVIESSSVEQYTPKYSPDDWLSVQAVEDRPSVTLSSLVGVPVDYGALNDFDIKRDIADNPVIGFSKVSGSKIRFSNLAGSSNMIYSWDFGDGSASDEQNPTHKYKKSGSYVIKLRVTDSEGNNASQLSIVDVKRPGFFGSILGIFGYEGGDEESYADKEKDLGGLITVSSKEPVRVSTKKGYYFSTTNRYLATVDANGIVRFADEFVPGSSVGIIVSNDDERFMTLIKYVNEGSEKPNAVFVADPPVDIKGNANAISFTTTSETIDENILAAASSEMSNAGVEEIKAHVESGARDALGELIKLKGEGWSQAYELIRKAYEGGETVKGISDDKCKCFENLLDYFKSQDDVMASLNFYSFCMCIYGYAGDSRVSFIGDLFCKWKMPNVPDPADMPSDTRKSWIENLDNTINECKDPGYIEKKTKMCEEAKKGCDKAKQLVEEAKKLVKEAERLTEEARKAYDGSRAANERAEKAAGESYIATNTADAVSAANKAAEAARESEAAAQTASKDTDEARTKSEEAKALLDQALELCPGKCIPKDGSSEVIESVNDERGKIWSSSQYWEYSRSAVMTAEFTGNIAKVAVEYANAKLMAEKKKSCEKALEYAKAALKASETIGPLMEGINKKLQEIVDAESELKQLEEDAVRIRTEERFEKGIKLRSIANDADSKIRSAEKALEDIAKLQEQASKLADDIAKIASTAEQALAEGDPNDPKCIEAKKMIGQAKDAANKAADAAGATNQAQQKLDAAKESKKKIDEIREEWEKKRRTIRAYTYTNSDGETVIWGGNGDAQPPEGATYHGTMQNGQWTDGGPPKIG